MRFTLSFVLSSALMLAGCGLTENFDKMKATTEEMQQTTSDLNQKTTDVLDVSCHLWRGGRQGTGQDQRNMMISQIISPNRSIMHKFRDAAVYFRALEFSVWTGIVCDTDLTKDMVLADGAEEFMTHFVGSIDGPFPDIEPLKAKSDLQSLFAFAATAEQINTLQIEASYKKGFTPMSMLDVVMSALSQESKLDEAENINTLPAYVGKILQYKKAAIYLLELRYNVFPLVVADKMYDISQMTLPSKLKLLLKNNLTVDTKRLNSAMLEEMTKKYLYSAIQIRTFARTLGVNFKLDGDLKKLLKKASIKEDPSAPAPKKRRVQEFKVALAALLCEEASCQNPIPSEEIEHYGKNYQYLQLTPAGDITEPEYIP